MSEKKVSGKTKDPKKGSKKNAKKDAKKDAKKHEKKHEKSAKIRRAEKKKAGHNFKDNHKKKRRVSKDQPKRKFLGERHKAQISYRHKLKRIAREKLEKKLKQIPADAPKPLAPADAWSTADVARPYVSVQRSNINKKAKKLPQICFPPVFMSPIRVNIVKFVHGGMAKNTRQPYAVFVDAGHQHSAESWGTGRAVSRIPRVSGGGTSRAGQGAFGNMCRSGRMFAPTKTWRKWHCKLNTKQKRYATVSALAATAIPSLVEARGHRISNVPEIPLVVDDNMEKLKKTKDAIALLENLGAYADVDKVKSNKKMRAGKGKMRNRRYVLKKGPLIVYNKDRGLTQAFRNLPGVDTCQVSNLSVLLLAPGGQVGRFIVWTQGAFDALNDLWGSWTEGSTKKKGFRLPRACMTHPDLQRIITSATIQQKMRARRTGPGKRPMKKNPLKNFGAMVKLNPYAHHVKRLAIIEHNKRAAGMKPRPNRKRLKAKKEHEWRKKYNYINMAKGKNIAITKEQFKKKLKRRAKLLGRGKRRDEARKAKKEAEEKKRAYFLDLKEKAKKGEKPTLKQIKHMIKAHRKLLKKGKKALVKKGPKKPKKKKETEEKGKKGSKKKVKGAKVSAKPEAPKPFKTYDNDECMGKEAPLEAIRKATYIQGKAPKEGNNVVVLLWRKSYKAGYKFMPLYSALSEEFKGKPVDVVGVCLDRDKNAPAGFLKKYHDGPKGNFTTTFPIAEEWAPANKVYPLKGRDIEKGFLDNMMDLHPGMKEIPSIPHVFIVNSHGTIVWHQDHSERGAMASDHMDEVKKQLTLLLSGKPLLSFGTKIVDDSDDSESVEEDDGDAAVGDMGDFFTNF